MLKNKWTNRLVVVLVAFGLLLGACTGAAAPEEYAGAVYVESQDAFYASEGAPANEKASFDDSLSITRLSEDQSVERLVIKNADLAIVVEDPSGSMDAIARLAEEMGGFVVSASLYNIESQSGAQLQQASISIRVPAERLNEALDIIKGESDQDPLSESLSSQDVTGDYVDLESRLGNLEAAEAQLQKIMEDAEETEDVLSVYNELVRVREEIEIIKGRMKYLEQSAALSSIHTELVADEAVQPLTIGGWQPAGVAKSAVQALINGLKFLGNIAIWVLIFLLPIVLILFVVVFLPVRWIVRRARKGRTKKGDESQLADKGEKEEPEK